MNDLEKELKKLKNLFDSELISKEVFEDRQKVLMEKRGQKE